jgi:branched-chain amino acid transport system substrate-binding protein
MVRRRNRSIRSVRDVAGVLALVALAHASVACGSQDDAADGAATSTVVAATTVDDPTDTATSTDDADDAAEDDEGTATSAPAEDEDEDDTGDHGADTDTETAAPEPIAPTLGPPTGEPIVVGLVNTEGTPGLDFPDIREAIEGGVDYLADHGGFGGRPIRLETCITNGSPEASQSCAQELVGTGVELVLLGLDLFADYATYSAAGVPVIGVLPILPSDYGADALFLTGGNVTVMTAVALTAQQQFGATSVGIVSADNPGTNSSEASLTAALDALGIAHVTVKGGDNETDAGFQGLVRETASSDPDVLVSLYADAGCIGMMRARVSLGIDVPVITTGVCSSSEVIDQVGDDAVGWNFVGVATRADTPGQRLLQEIMAPVLGVEPDEVDQSSLGLGALGLFLVMSIADYAHQVAETGGEVTGASIRDHLATADGLLLWPGNSPVTCGAAPAYPSICSFTFPVAEYVAGGEVRTIEGLEALSVLDHLP